MFIRKSTQKNPHNGESYSTYRLVQTYRNTDGKVKQYTLLNLGSHFSTPVADWPLLSQRITQLISGDVTQQDLFPIKLKLSLKLEKEAQRIAKMITKMRPTKEEQASAAMEPDYQTVDIDSTKDSDARHIGNEHVGYHAACQLNLPAILSEVGLNDKQANIALGSILGRLIAPGSECKAHRYLTQDSALDEIIGTEFSGLDIKQLYLASDWLYANKDRIEAALYQQEKTLFNLQEVVTLFDITNTYFEGHNNHPDAKPGRSKEKRSDCQLMSLGLLLDGSGFPRKSKILPGNISEPSTLKDMLSGLDSKSGTIIVMDAGIATQENIEYIKSEGYNYITVKRDKDLVMPENDTVIVKDTPNNIVTVSLKPSDGDINEVNLYCHSTAKEGKVIEFTNKMTKRFEEELTKINNNLPSCELSANLSELGDESAAVILSDGSVFRNKLEPITLIVKSTIIPACFIKNEELTQLVQKDAAALKSCAQWNGQIRGKSKLQSTLRKLFRQYVQATKPNVTRELTKLSIKLGRLKQQYKSVAHLYDINVVANQKKSLALRIDFTKQQDKLEQKTAGLYCLSSNLTKFSATDLWETYTTLTDIEAAFRSLKSELGLRPVYHQLEHRIDGHLFISILAYHLLHTIRYQLKQSGISNSWDGIRQILAMQIRTTTTMQLKGGGSVRIRKTSVATPEQKEIYNSLKISASPCGMSKTYFK